MHSTSFKTALTVTMVIGIALAAPQPEKSDLSNEIMPPGGFVSKKGESVSASWGGFHASASLADDGSAVASAGGNGLGAGAGYGTGGAGAGAGVEYGAGGAGAGAGLYGAETGPAGAPVQPPVAAGGYGNGGKPGKPGVVGGSNVYQQGGPGNGAGFFDRIFAIPINVLQSVNTYLNQKQQYQGQQVSTHGHQNNNGGAAFAGASATAGSASYGGADKVPEASVGADYGHQSAGATVGAAGATAGATGHGKHHGAPMMIPITALRSVQNLLNG